ncbi:hypothetical protein BBOR36S_01145 [Brevibacillus borstelensis]
MRPRKKHSVVEMLPVETPCKLGYDEGNLECDHAANQAEHI